MPARARVLLNGRDFAPSYIFQAQDGPRVVGGFSMAYGAGAFHPNFEVMDSYPMRDLRVRFSLAGVGVKASDLGDGRMVLEAGGWRAVLHRPRCAVQH